MRVNLNEIDKELFYVKSGRLGEEECYLVTPRYAGCKWDKNNIIFRSSIWNCEGELVSASYPKFFNLGEHPHLTENIPDRFEHNNLVNVVEKIDGSTLIVTSYKGHLSLRSRGTFCAYILPNGSELDIFKYKYKEFFNFIESNYTLDKSYIFEWVSPDNLIVIKYLKPELYLTNVINHLDYSLATQDEVDEIAARFKFKRPNRYSFNNLQELISSIQSDNDIEGVCIYYNNDQTIRKCKSLLYLKLHYFKSNLSLKALIELYLTNGRPLKDDFKKFIETTFDWECLAAAEGHIESMYAIVNKFNKEIEELKGWVNNNRGLSRKEFAIHVINTYGSASYCKEFCFSILDRNKVQDNYYEKVLKSLAANKESQNNTI